MKKGFSLQLILNLALRQADALSREVKRSHGEWLLARGQRVQLLALRDRHIHELAGELRPGIAAADLSLRTQRMQRQQAELQQAALRIDTSRQAWQAKLAEWMQLQDRVKALRVLEQRYMEALGIQARRTEQRQHDELAQNSRFWHQDQASEETDSEAINSGVFM